MTEEQINRSIETKELKMGRWRMFSHYSISILFLFMAAAMLFYFLNDILTGRDPKVGKTWPALVLFMVVPFILGIVYIRIQRKKLRFYTVTTTQTREQLKKIIRSLAKEQNWQVSFSNEKAIELKSSPGFWSGSWGEQITILFDKETVLVNSICDPDERSSITSYGRNKKNIALIVEEIKNASL